MGTLWFLSADDHSRVRLSTQTDSGGQTGDYINANYVDVRNRFYHLKPSR